MTDTWRLEPLLLFFVQGLMGFVAARAGETSVWVGHAGRAVTWLTSFARRRWARRWICGRSATKGEKRARRLVRCSGDRVRQGGEKSGSVVVLREK